MGVFTEGSPLSWAEILPNLERIKVHFDDAFLNNPILVITRRKHLTNSFSSMINSRTEKEISCVGAMKLNTFWSALTMPKRRCQIGLLWDEWIHNLRRVSHSVPRNFCRNWVPGRRWTMWLATRIGHCGDRNSHRTWLKALRAFLTEAILFLFSCKYPKFPFKAYSNPSEMLNVTCASDERNWVAS